MGVFQRVFDSVAETLDDERGAWTGLWAATAAVGPEEGVLNGGLYKPFGRRVEGDRWCRDEGLMEELWEWTVGELRRVGIEVE